MFLFWVFYDFFFFLCNLTNRWLSELCISGITSTSLVWLAITRPQSCQSCFRLCIRARNIGTSKKTIFSQPLLYLFLESLLKSPPFPSTLCKTIWDESLLLNCDRWMWCNFILTFSFHSYFVCIRNAEKLLAGINFKTSFKSLEYYRYIKFLKVEEK